MSRNVEQPTVTLTPDHKMHESVETHPAYAQIGASRVMGSVNLYGSDFTHNSHVAIHIHKSELARSLSHDWHHARGEYIEVQLSEAQWATFVSTLNVGQGVPCTVRAVDGIMLPELPVMRAGLQALGATPIIQLDPPCEPIPHHCFMCKEEDCDCGTTHVDPNDPFSRGCGGCRRCVVDGPPEVNE